jgi:putative ABC transport system permease protein
MKSILFIAWRNIFRNPRRTLASLFTITLGAGGLLIYQGFNTGLMNQYRENTIHGYYGYGQIFPAGYYNKVLDKPWEKWFENPEEIEKKLRELPGVTDVFPRISFYAFLVHGGITLGGKGEGVVPERENRFFTEMNFIDGAPLSGNDEIILGKGLADSLGVKSGDTVTVLSQTVNSQLNGLDLKVAGVFHLGIKAFDDRFFRVSLSAAQQLLDTHRVELFSLATTGVEAWPKIKNVIDLPENRGEAISFDVLDKVYYQNSVDFLDAQFRFVRMIILIIVALGIFNTIAVGLMERRGEIGALRANGESRSRLWKILILENAFLGLLGGVIGMVLAVVLDKLVLSKGIPMPPGPGITRNYLIYLEIQKEHYLQAMLLPLITVMLASLLPIRKILTEKIPDLLRSN